MGARGEQDILDYQVSTLKKTEQLLPDSELLVDDPVCLGEADDAVITLAHSPDAAADGEGLVGPSHPAGVGAHVFSTPRFQSS